MSPYATGHAHLKFTFRKCTSFLNSEYNFQIYWRVINVQQYRVRRNPRAQRCSVSSNYYYTVLLFQNTVHVRRIIFKN